MNSSRRIFLIKSAAAACVPLINPVAAFARAEQHLDESDPEARAFNYHRNASEVDLQRFPQYRSGACCASCGLLTRQVGNDTGRCAIFAEKEIALTGWCTNYSAKRS